MAGAPPLVHPPAIDQVRGRFALVHYGIRGDPTWHARLLLGHVTGGEWVILTPDGDIYAEDLGFNSADIADWRIFEPGGPIPPGIDVNHIHQFNPFPDQATMTRLLQEGEVYVSMEKLQRGLPLVAPPPAAAPVGGGAGAALVAAGPPPAVGPPNLAGGVAAPAAVAAPGAPAVAAPANPVGVAVNPPVAAAPAAAGCGQLAAIAGGGMGAAAHGDQGNDDARTLSITRDSQGQRFKEFRVASLECKEVAFPDWPISGPRTVAHVLQRIVEHGGSPIAHSQAWRTACKFQPVDKPAQDHEMLCRILQTMLVYDQLDATNIASAELIARAIQRIEEQHKMKLASLEDAGESALFLGSSGGSRVGTCISPKLSEWMGSEMQKEAAIAKERRKAREERLLSRKQGGDKEGK